MNKRIGIPIWALVATLVIILSAAWLTIALRLEAVETAVMLCEGKVDSLDVSVSGLAITCS